MFNAKYINLPISEISWEVALKDMALLIYADVWNVATDVLWIFYGCIWQVI